MIQIQSRSKEEQRWVVEPGPNGAFFIRSAVNGRALQITSDAKSTPVVCARFDGSPAQQWRMEPASDGNPFIVSAAAGARWISPTGLTRRDYEFRFTIAMGTPTSNSSSTYPGASGPGPQTPRAGWDR